MHMESAMRKMVVAGLVAASGVLACLPARADYVPPFKANDTGGIIAYSLAAQSDARQLAVDPHYGGYVSFACRWVPYGAVARPLRTKY